MLSCSAKAQAIVVAATAHDLCAVVVAEMKAARQIICLTTSG